ncbi:serine/threonine-protein kinase [Micromonospora sp. RP3T]|uniref:serine/threonine-protein kinase n=1 Tax=Micromonospora sp. RP3T TaxID=2135446 RepID=UPI000D174EA2|nr:serine/threonine-protein kinase [Micromonospora sp. RP3T]PTA42485.1 serine/threonine protein kinase [Micromonospora sp. RP3T]
MLMNVVAGESLKGRYAVSRYPLAHKGMGEVWSARDSLLDRPVIVKVVGAMDVDLVRRFRREALLTARLDHPGIPAIYDIGEHDGRPFVVLQEINGITLSDLVAEHGPLPIAWVAAIGAQICSVLLAAQRIRLVHRDIKPSNVMLDRSGAVKVLDFGLAVMRDDERYSRITQSGQSLGTVGYMAPEQVTDSPVDHRTDLYGLGGTLFDVLTGRAPFDGLTTMTTVHRQLGDPPPRASEFRADVPAELDDLIFSLMAVNPQDRPASAAEAYRVLVPLIHGLSPLPGIVTDDIDPVRAYAAVLSRSTSLTAAPAARSAPASDWDADLARQHAERLQAAGEHRAAARAWRQLADDVAQRNSDGHELVFDFRRRAALAHVPLGEHDRAHRQLNKLLEDRLRIAASDDSVVAELRREIAQLSNVSVTPGPRPGSAAGGGR